MAKAQVRTELTRIAVELESLETRLTKRVVRMVEADRSYFLP